MLKQNIQKRICIFLIIFILAFSFCYNIYNINDSFNVSIFFKMVLSLTIICVGIERINLRWALCVIGILGILWTINMPVFSPVDEAAHYLYVDYICENHRLPVISEMMNSDLISALAGEATVNIPEGIMYEAVHPPLYYVCMALLCNWFEWTAVRFWICRFVGIILLLGVTCVIFKWCNYLLKQEIIKKEEQTNLLLAAMIILCCPGILTRFGTVSNEGLAVLLVSMCLYQFTKVIFEGISKKKFLFLSILIVCAVLTKITTCFVIVLWLLILLYYKKIRKMVISISIIATGMSPWVLYNYLNYGSFTGTKKHLEYALPICNPNKETIDILSGVAGIFTRFFYPSEGNMGSITQIIVNFLDILLLGGLVYFGIKCIKILYKMLVKKRCQYTYQLEEKKELMEVTYFLCVLGNILILILGSVGTFVSVINGRYLYLSIMPIIYIVQLLSVVKNEERKYTNAMIGFCVVFLGIENILGYAQDDLDKIVGMQCAYESIDMNSMDVNDILLEEKTIVCIGKDPQIVLKKINRECKMIEVLLEEDVSGKFELFYASDGEFAEQKKIVSEYNSKFKSVRFILPKQMEISDVRIDPPINKKIKIDEIRIY